LLNNISVSWNPLGSHSHIKKKEPAIQRALFVVKILPKNVIQPKTREIKSIAQHPALYE